MTTKSATLEDRVTAYLVAHPYTVFTTTQLLGRLVPGLHRYKERNETALALSKLQALFYFRFRGPLLPDKHGRYTRAIYWCNIPEFSEIDRTNVGLPRNAEPVINLDHAKDAKD